jgi:multiple sugar transport system ATP-binding protein
MYEAPETSFVATFLGTPKMNLVDATTEGGTIAAGPFTIPRSGRDVPSRVVVGIRPEDVFFQADGAEMEVVVAEPLGAETHLLLRSGEVELRMRAPGFDPRAPGSRVRVGIDSAKVHVFAPGEDGRRLS